LIQRHGWTLLFHEGVIAQLRKLYAAAARAEQSDPHGFEGNVNVKLFRGESAKRRHTKQRTGCPARR
jgi:toxin YhaV